MIDSVDASPTKQLVAYVLIKDIKLEDAILDLIDNSIDGARRSGKKLFHGFDVKVAFNASRFTIEDNCGGIPYDIARDYAFRFGRPDKLVPLDGPPDLIGNFGIGMKRALFKMGRTIAISSRTTSRNFKIIIDVESWLANDTDWSFAFSDVVDIKNPLSATGTTIEVSDLYPGVAEQFRLKQFALSLKALTKEKQTHSLVQGLNLSINQESLIGVDMQLLASRDIKPFYKAVTVESPDGDVNVQIYAGLDAPDNDSAGWYIICNGRTILSADRSSVTGWGNKLDGDRVPSYHHQYARFRGYLVFHSDNPKLLPWNTMKSGVDAEHPLYRRFFQEMVSSMRQVFGFLNAVDRESDTAEQLLTEKLDKLKTVPLKNVKVSETFVYPVSEKVTKVREKLRWIRYQRPIVQVEEVMRALSVDRPEDAGEQTFDLYYSFNVSR